MPARSQSISRELKLALETTSLPLHVTVAVTCQCGAHGQPFATRTMKQLRISMYGEKRMRERCRARRERVLPVESFQLPSPDAVLLKPSAFLDMDLIG